MFNPVSTYRIQFHSGFTFKQFIKIIPYLSGLGVRTIYASPILEAIPGSMHGYDTTNPLRINPEIGTEKELIQISKVLKELKMNWLQDIVPNHMAFHHNNLWLMDVLEKGITSDYAAYFDINWSADNTQPIMVPFLGEDLDAVIEKGELKLVEEEDKQYLRYHEDRWPINKLVDIDELNNDTDKFKSLVNSQYYRLCNWQETDTTINYRRFFTVNGLICLNIQEQETFDAYHVYIKSLLEKGLIQGLRVDHIDGLSDPEVYLNRLRDLAGSDIYITIEKILEEGELLPERWPVQGTTGYDFLALVNNLLSNKAAEKDLDNYYKEIAGVTKPVKDQILEKKANILFQHMQGELENLYQLFSVFHLVDPTEKDVPQAGLIKKAIAELLIHCPVYRFYGNQFPLDGTEKKELKQLLNKIASDNELAPAVKLLKYIWLEKPEEGNEDYNEAALKFYLRCMQFSGPLMAKGVEDTLMYTYNRFIVHNEVGDAPESFGISTEKFHELMEWRQQHLPLSVNASATHDTKRGEDVRARLNALSDVPEYWIELVRHWKIINAQLIQQHQIDPADEYFIYQTLAGTYPMPGEQNKDYAERLHQYLEKALREGKQKSNWASPDLSYEKAVQEFTDALLDKDSAFWTSFCVLHKKISDFGIVNSMVQLLLKFTLPGIPDVYQGTEFWDLSMVDPDNRRAVDYTGRWDYLNKITPSLAIDDLWDDRYSGTIKLWLQQLLFNERLENEEYYTMGDYIPLKVKGKFSKNVFAFARRFKDNWSIVAVPLHLAGLTEGQYESILCVDWKDTRIILPETIPGNWENLLTHETGAQQKESILIGSVFGKFPLALLKMTGEKFRASGILLHITSLPSFYGIGDLGLQSRHFVDFLFSAGQKYWQILPLNPISAEQAYSPYSSVSSMAGNTWLISPDILVDENLLDQNWLDENVLPSTDKVDFNAAGLLKEKILDKAFQNYKENTDAVLKEQFEAFCTEEISWLKDFILYTALKLHHQNASWVEWEPAFKSRDSAALKKFEMTNEALLEKFRWQQFIFFRQWKALKSYANNCGIKLFGDLPFYVGHDSADVWANPDFFNLDKEGKVFGIAGVPPDYFNAEGQLWGMPVYRWDMLEADGYAWWLRRMHKNMELYNVLRLDHFRAFYNYWEVPQHEINAIRGSWKFGPGADFLTVLLREFPDMPFIAEDLGEINLEVFVLRDQFKLPGMKVLQFAFGEDMAVSPYIPFRYESDNFVVYTGTHDNNTTLGWYRNDLSKRDRKRLKAYVSGKVGKKNIHTVLTQIALASIAKLVIIPLQDVIGLDEESRMNIPSSVINNWSWHLKAGVLDATYSKQLLKWVKIYGRF